jgi:hypothetical protein
MAKYAVRRTPLQLPLWFNIAQGLANMQRKNSVSMADGNFLIVIHPYSLVKATMNAPHICKLRKNYLTGILTSAQWCYQNASISWFSKG